MILKQLGQAYEYGAFSESFYVGQEVVAGFGSDYTGLTGVITAIVDGDDLETGNDGPDIYCSFDAEAPHNSIAVSVVKERLKVSEEPAGFDEIIMSPDMLEPKMKFQINPLERQLYILTCFVDCDAENDDYMLCVSRDHDLLKKKMDVHAEQNKHLKNIDSLWTHEDDTDGVYRRSYKNDSGMYICYSIIPVNYEME